MELQDKEVLVIGTGISGIGAARLLLQVGARPVLFDGNDKLDIEEIRKKLEGVEGIRIVLGEVPEEMKEKIDLLVISPEFPLIPSGGRISKKNVPVIGEIELASQFAKGKIVAITGTNGKTTTTTLTGDIMKAYYDSVFVVGNIGNPLPQRCFLRQRNL